MALPPNQIDPPRRSPERGGETDAPNDLAAQDDGDRFAAALCYALASLPVPIFAAISAFVQRHTPGYRRFHAQQAIALGVLVLAVEFFAALLGGGDAQSTPVVVVAFAALAVEIFYGWKAWQTKKAFAIPLVTPVARSLFRSFPSAEELGEGRSGT